MDVDDCLFLVEIFFPFFYPLQVHLFVASEFVGLGKFFSTDFTLERLFPDVNPPMNLERVVPCKFLDAEVTLNGFFSGFIFVTELKEHLLHQYKGRKKSLLQWRVQ